MVGVYLTKLFNTRAVFVAIAGSKYSCRRFVAACNRVVCAVVLWPTVAFRTSGTLLCGRAVGCSVAACCGLLTRVDACCSAGYGSGFHVSAVAVPLFTFVFLNTLSHVLLLAFFLLKSDFCLLDILA